MSTVEMDHAAPESAAHHALPDPGEAVPRLALPTVGIFLAALTAFVAATRNSCLGAEREFHDATRRHAVAGFTLGGQDRHPAARIAATTRAMKVPCR